MNKQEILKIARELMSTNSNESFVRLQLQTKHNISFEEADNVINIVKQENLTPFSGFAGTMGHSTHIPIPSHHHPSIYHSFHPQPNSNLGLAQQKFSSQIDFPERSSSPPQKLDREQMEIRLIDLRVKKESEAMKKVDKRETFQKSASLDLCRFTKCIADEQNISNEEYRMMHKLAEKKRTKLLYLMHLGLDMERICAFMAKEEVSEEKMKRMLQKVKNHSIAKDYFKYISLRNIYDEKAQSFSKNNTSVWKIFSNLFAVNSSEDEKQSSKGSQKGNKDSKKDDHSQVPRTSKKINLDKLNSMDELQGLSGCFVHDEKNGRYSLKVEGKVNGHDVVYLRDSNYNYLKSKNKLERKIVGTIDWVSEEKGEKYGCENGKTVLVVGAKC